MRKILIVAGIGLIERVQNQIRIWDLLIATCYQARLLVQVISAGQGGSITTVGRRKISITRVVIIGISFIAEKSFVSHVNTARRVIGAIRVVVVILVVTAAIGSWRSNVSHIS